MTDMFTVSERSRIMSRIRSRGNETTELRLINIMRMHGIAGWRRSQSLAGDPDFVFRKRRTVVFVDGCFWHGCPSCYRSPRSNRGYWRSKVLGNQQRDRKTRVALRKIGWKVVRIWEHQLRCKPEAVAERIKQALTHPAGNNVA